MSDTLNTVLNWFDNSLYAAQQAAQPDIFTSMLPLFVIFAIFYFLMIRPQTKRHKEHQKMIAEIAEGAEIITSGGMLGKVLKAGEQFLTVKLADGIEVKVQRHHVSKVLPKGTFKSA